MAEHTNVNETEKNVPSAVDNENASSQETSKSVAVKRGSITGKADNSYKSHEPNIKEWFVGFILRISKSLLFKIFVYIILMAISIVCTGWIGAMFQLVKEPDNAQSILGLLSIRLFRILVYATVASAGLQVFITSKLFISEKKNNMEAEARNNLEKVLDAKDKTMDHLMDLLTQSGMAKMEMDQAKDFYEWLKTQEKDERGIG